MTMVKTVFTWRDNPGLSAEECEAHYRTVHMALARSAYTDMDGFIALVYNRVRQHSVNDSNVPIARPTPTDVDAYCELWFRDHDSMSRGFDHPALALMFADHCNFMDTERQANIHIYDVEETVILGRRPGDALPTTVTSNAFDPSPSERSTARHERDTFSKLGQPSD
jgi:hypothetical protein